MPARLSRAALLGGRTPKVFRGSSERAVAPSETLARVAPLLSRFGITRVANVTGLDRIGVPVYQAIRPNARSLSVSQGKGVDAASSKVSAIMEAIELSYAERPTLPLRLGAYDELAAEGAADPMELPLSRPSAYRVGHPLLWAPASDVSSDGDAWVPFELVHACATAPLIAGSGCFVRSTNGLASGNTGAEAVLHGLCEVVERDALALFAARSAEFRDAGRLDLDTVADATCREALARFDRAEFSAFAWNVTSDVGIPAVHVLLADRSREAALNPSPSALGSGCHPVAATALLRALTEAAQGRLGVIAGSRDDLTRTRYAAMQSSLADERFRREAERAGLRNFRELPSFEADSVEGDLAHVLARLAAVGCPRVLAVDLSGDDVPFVVVRVVVPGLEGPSNSPAYSPGRRARAVS
ncbi:MAG TPA: YcaO-like family protein [Polyangiaceae bacterium]|nr:YcaO-like family protein [Polyangiaceae bacterium]